MTKPPKSTVQTLAAAIGWHAALHPERVAIVGSSLAPCSFQELDQHVGQVGDQLRAAGVGHSSRVGILLPKGPEAAVIGVAIAAQAVSVPLNPTLTGSELEEAINRFGLDALVLPSWLALPASMAALSGSHGILKATRAVGSLASVAIDPIREVAGPPHELGNASPHSIALILTTSGTTGAGKLVPVTHLNLLEMASKMRSWFNLSSEDRCGCLLPVYYAQGFKTALLVPLLLGGSVALPATRHVDHLAEWIGDLRPTWFSASPTYLQAVLDHLRSGRAGRLEHSLRFILSSSAYLPEALRTELEAILGVPVLEFYGLSEAGIMAANPAPPAKRKPGTAGMFSPNELAIRHPNGDLLCAGEIGEIVVRGPSVTPGYLNDAAGKDVTGIEGGWLSTGDLGFVDPDGFLTIVGRTKEVINRGGEKISPYDIEKALLRHPSVQEAAAFAVPHPRLGENVAAAVVLNPGTNTTPTDLRDFLYGKLARFKVPQHVFVVPSMPKGSTGKVLRSQLSEAISLPAREAAPPRGQIENQIGEIWHKLLGRTDFGVEDDFFEAGGDSLQAAQMLLEVESVTGRRISDSALRGAYSIRRLAADIADGMPARAELVTFAKPGSRTPFFFCHGDYYTRGIYVMKFVDVLEDDQPVVSLHPDSRVDVGNQISIEAMARSYLPHLLAIQPTGSFRLGGYCNGGLLAWEIAHQLGQAGRRVEFLVLIDTISINARPVIRALVKGLMLIARSGSEGVGEKIKRGTMRSLWHWVRRIDQRDSVIVRRAIKKIFPALASEEAVGPDPLLGHLGPTYFGIMAAYVPPKIDSTIYCLPCEQSRGGYKFSPSPWKHLARDVHCEYISGDHQSCVSTHIGELGGVLRRLLLRCASLSDPRETL